MFRFRLGTIPVEVHLSHLLCLACWRIAVLSPRHCRRTDPS